jgi:hypothetical protein
VPNDVHCREVVDAGGGEQVAEAGEEPQGRRRVRFDDRAGQGARRGAGERGPRPAGVVVDAEERPPVVGLPIMRSR